MVDVKEKFITLGLDSIIGVEWIKDLNKQYGTDIPATRVYEHPTIIEFADFLKSELNDQKEIQAVEIVNPYRMDGQIQSPAVVLSSLDPATDKQIGSPMQAQEERNPQSLIVLQDELKTSLAKALYLERDMVDVKEKFITLGLDSIIGVEWIKDLNKQYGTDIPATRVYEYPTIIEFAEFLIAELNELAPIYSLDEIIMQVYEGELNTEEASHLLLQLKEES